MTHSDLMSMTVLQLRKLAREQKIVLGAGIDKSAMVHKIAAALGCLPEEGQIRFDEILHEDPDPAPSATGPALEPLAAEKTPVTPAADPAFQYLNGLFSRILEAKERHEAAVADLVAAREKASSAAAEYKTKTNAWTEAMAKKTIAQDRYERFLELERAKNAAGATAAGERTVLTATAARSSSNSVLDGRGTRIASSVQTGDINGTGFLAGLVATLAAGLLAFRKSRRDDPS